MKKFDVVMCMTTQSQPIRVNDVLEFEYDEDRFICRTHYGDLTFTSSYIDTLSIEQKFTNEEDEDEKL